MLRLLSFLSLATACAAWTTTSSMMSSFGGSVLLTDRPPTQQCTSLLTMKKGKPNVPPQLRGQYKRQQQMANMREQMISASTPGEDGLPVFNLFVRTKKQNMWYPCGSFKGDQQSSSLAKSYADGGLLAGISKKQLNGGIAGSLYRDKDKLAESVVRAYPQLRKSRNDFEYGYKLAFEGLSKEQSEEITPVEPKETKGVFDNIKNIFS